MHISLAQLSSFLVAADLGTITAAARALSYSQPAISLHIQGLERGLGTRLFERGGSRLRLTDAGEELQRSGIVILALIRETCDRLALCDVDGALSRGSTGFPATAPTARSVGHFDGSSPVREASGRPQRLN